MVLTVTEAGLQALKNKRNARTELVAHALTGGEFTPSEMKRSSAAAAPLLERLAQKWTRHGDGTYARPPSTWQNPSPTGEAPMALRTIEPTSAHADDAITAVANVEVIDVVEATR